MNPEQARMELMARAVALAEEIRKNPEDKSEEDLAAMRDELEEISKQLLEMYRDVDG